MFKHPVEVLISTMKDLEKTLLANQKSEHLSEQNIEDIQKTISYLSQKIIGFYESENKNKNL